ncbi:MAG: outer membrane beta-barrel protein [Gammaproteobacteria bacterium]|nr:outer membrane beta-barrel protein [Gammaproteobacteria bacterium]
MVVTGIWLASGVAVAGELYLRGGLGFDQLDNTEFTDADCASTVPAALYGCGIGGDGAHYRSVGDFDEVLALELGLGYATGATRIEMQLEYRPRFEFEGRANFLAPNRQQSVSANLSSVSGMLAGYVDFDGLVLPTSASLVPFVGAGIGAVRTRIGKTTMTFPATTTIVPGDSRTQLAWMATAGFAISSEEGVSLDLAWRYTDLGGIRTPQGSGSVVWHDGSRQPLLLDLAPTKAGLRGHGIRLSLRYTPVRFSR